MTFLTESEVRALPIGTRLAFPNGAECYPSFRILEPLTGTLVDMQDDCAWIRLDTHHADLDEWENQIQVWFWDDKNDPRCVFDITLDLGPVAL